MNTALRALIVEDSEDDALLLVRELERADYSVTAERVDTPETVRAALAKEAWDVVISDYTMPQFRGTDALELLKQTGLDIPFIFVSGTIGEDTAVAAMKAGAHDYMRKDNLKRLIPAIERELREAEVRREHRRAEDRAKRRQEQIRALHEINLAMTSVLDLRSILDILLEKLELFLPRPSAGTVRLYNRETGKLDPVACNNLDEAEWKADGEGLHGRWARSVFETGAPLMVRNIQIDPRARDQYFFRKYGMKSYLGAPLSAKGEVLGVLSFYTQEEHEFSEEETEFVCTLAGQAAVAIENARLYQAVKEQAEELQQANNVKAEFLSVVSHELRTPLTTVMGYVSTIRDRLLGEINPRQEQALERALKCSQELEGLINSLLEASRVESRVVIVAKGEVALKGLLDELRSLYPASVGDEVDMAWDYPPDLPVVLTDGAKLKQIVRNLIDNAIKFTYRGHILVSARTAADSGEVEVRVSDTGIGIPTEAMNFIFERFRQLDSSQTRFHPGVGLGLHIVKTFTEMLGGKVEVESEPGEGSTFTVTLPCERAGKSKPPAPRETHAPSALQIGPRADLYETEIYEAVFRVVLESDVDAIVAADRQGRMVFVSGQTAKMFGYNRSELLGSRFEFLLPERFRKTYVEYREASVSHPRTRPMGAGLNLIGQRKDGTEFPAEISLRSLITDGGLLVVNVIRDLTEQRLAEDALERKIQAVQALVRINHDIASLLDRDALLPRIAEEARRILSVDSVSFHLIEGGELVRVGLAGGDDLMALRQKLPLRKSLSGEVIREGRALYVKDIQEGPALIKEHRTQLRRAGYRSFLGIPVKVGERAIGSLNLYSKKEREFHADEIQLITAFADQAAIAIENANVLAEVRNKSAKLEQANRVKTEFLNIVSHELRTPLVVVMGYAAMIKDGLMGEINTEQQRALELVLKQSNELLTIITNVLYTTAIESDTIQVESSEVTLGELLSGLESRYGIPMDRELALAWDYPSDLPTIETDCEKLRLILQNLIDNALKFTAKGSVVVSARPVPEAEAVEIKVADTGIGIPEEHLFVIFDKFHQGDTSATRLYGGMGLGLYIVGKLTERLGGTIGVESRHGEGSTFTIIIPYHRKARVEDPER